jgi:hypothetical protein
MMRGMLPRVLIAVSVFSCVTVGVTGGQSDQGFSTNLALLSRLAEEAVSSVLDSLDIRPGEEITIVSAAFHEGNDFIAEQIARDLALRGVAVRIASESAQPSTPATTPQTSPAPVDSSSLAAASAADSAGAVADSLKTRFASDSTAVFPGSPQAGDSLKAESTAGEDSSAAKSAEAAEHGLPTQAAPVVERTAPTVKPYPEGTVLEYRILEFGVTYPVLKRRFLLFGDASVRRLGGVYLSASRIRGPEGTILKLVEAQSHSEDYLPSRARLRAEGASYPFTKPVVPPANVGKYFEPVAVAGIVTSLVYLFYQNQH